MGEAEGRLCRLMAQLDTKAMLDDVRARDTALLTLILSNDRQAMALFRIYITIGSATAVAAAAGFLETDGFASQTKWATLAVTMVLAVASYLCQAGMTSSEVGLPGKGGDFWLWARDEAITEETALRTYLQYAKEHQELNVRVNTRAFWTLIWAKRLGMAAPIIGLIAGAASLFFTDTSGALSRSSSHPNSVVEAAEVPAAAEVAGAYHSSFRS
jgi:hypothetical protein